jgi:hypothetical protein
MDDRAAARKMARSKWRTKVFRSWEEAEDYDVEFWLSIPPHERARRVWEISLEMTKIAYPGTPDEPRLSRSVVVITRR